MRHAELEKETGTAQTQFSKLSVFYSISNLQFFVKVMRRVEDLCKHSKVFAYLNGNVVV